jgi:hypothetical protein
VFLYPPKKLGTSFGSWVFEPLLNDILDLQTSTFKLTTKTKAHKAMEELKDENHVTKLWR